MKMDVLFMDGFEPECFGTMYKCGGKVEVILFDDQCEKMRFYCKSCILEVLNQDRKEKEEEFKDTKRQLEKEVHKQNKVLKEIEQIYDGYNEKRK